MVNRYLRMVNKPLTNGKQHYIFCLRMVNTMSCSCDYCGKHIKRLTFCNPSHKVLYHRKGKPEEKPKPQETKTPQRRTISKPEPIQDKPMSIGDYLKQNPLGNTQSQVKPQEHPRLSYCPRHKVMYASCGCP